MPASGAWQVSIHRQRGGAFCLLVPACDLAADVGLIILQPDRARVIIDGECQTAFVGELAIGPCTAHGTACPGKAGSVD